jgi:hypothetical protein
MKVHDSLSVSTHGEIRRFVVGRTQINEAAIAVIACLGGGWIPAAMASGLWRLAIGAIVIGAATVFARRAFRICIESTPERLRILNYWRTFEFPWRDVRDVGVGSLTQGVLPQPAIAFRRADGRVIRAQATPRNLLERRQLMEALAVDAPSETAWH